MFLPGLLSPTCPWPHTSNIQLQSLLRKFKHSKIRKINSVLREREIGKIELKPIKRDLVYLTCELFYSSFIAISKDT